MNGILSLGAKNKTTGEYVYPQIADKKEKYICPDCKKDLMLCKGKIRIAHFRHYKDKTRECNYYNSPTESQIHKDAKMLMKYLLENKKEITFVRKCIECEEDERCEIPIMNDESSVKLEYRFDYNGLKIADVGYLVNNELRYIFEICHTHKTEDENRPEPWFEIEATKLIKTANEKESTRLEINCMRSIRCIKCKNLNDDNKNIKEENLEKYVRMKLGQKYPIPEYNKNGRKIHLKIDFDAQNQRNSYIDESIKNNKKIIDIFQEDFGFKKVVILSCKGSIDVFIVSEYNYKKYDYWNKNNYFNYIYNELPYEKHFDFIGEGTVNIIKELIKYCQKDKKFNVENKCIDCDKPCNKY